MLRVGGALSLLTALAGALSTAATSAQCSGDGSFSISDPQARPNRYCKLTHLPGLPPDLQTALLLGAIFFTPVLLIALGATLAARQQRSKPLTWAAVLAAAWLIASLVSAAFAHVGFAGYG